MLSMSVLSIADSTECVVIFFEWLCRTSVLNLLHFDDQNEFLPLKIRKICILSILHQTDPHHLWFMHLVSWSTYLIFNNPFYMWLNNICTKKLKKYKNSFVLGIIKKCSLKNTIPSNFLIKLKKKNGTTCSTWSTRIFFYVSHW